MTQCATHLYRERLVLERGQDANSFTFNPNIEGDYTISKSYCQFEYIQGPESKITPLHPVEVFVVDAQGHELVYLRLGAYRDADPQHHGVVCRGSPEIVILNPNIANRCQLVVTLFLELTVDENDEESVETETPIEVHQNSDTSWQEYLKRQQKRRKEAFGVAKTKSPGSSWLQLLLISWCLTFSYIPVSHFELLLCLLVL